MVGGGVGGGVVGGNGDRGDAGVGGGSEAEDGREGVGGVGGGALVKMVAEMVVLAVTVKRKCWRRWY